MVAKGECQSSLEDDWELIDQRPPGKTSTGINGQRVRGKRKNKKFF